MSFMASVALRPVSYSLLMTLTVVFNPVDVEAFRINSTARSSVSNNIPVQARLTCGKNRRSIGLYFEQ